MSMSTRSTAGWGARRQLDMPLPCSLMCRARICTPAELPRLKEVTHANASLLGQSLLILIAVLTGLSALPQASDQTTSTLHSLLRFLLCFLRLRYRLVPASTFPVSKEQVRYSTSSQWPRVGASLPDRKERSADGPCPDHRVKEDALNRPSSKKNYCNISNPSR